MATPASSKPKLKLSVSRAQSFSDPSAATAATPSTITAGTPAATPSGDGPKKIKLRRPTLSQPPTPAEPPSTVPVVTQAGRQTKPTTKLVESKKRYQDDADGTDGGPGSARPSKRVKILTRQVSRGNIIVKGKGKPPVHPPGDGYDSEASDRELDPSIEEQIILRMMPGEHSEYIRNCIREHKIGLPRQHGGADLQMKFFDEDSRRAMVTVKGQPYAAVLVDLPTITESMKTWDKKALMKSADICQMLLVFQKVKSEDEARKAALPKAIESGFKWPHGLTPPMHDCVHRRFAKTISRKEIEDKEAEVERLLASDRLAESSKWEWVDDRRQRSVEYESDEEDAEGEIDDSSYFPPQGPVDVAGGEDFDDLEADLEAELEKIGTTQAETQTPATQMEGVTPMTGEAGTPAVNGKGGAEDDLFGEGADDDEEDEDDDMDEDEQARLDEIRGVREDIADLRKQLKELEAKLPTMPSLILRKRIDERVRLLKRELQLKLTSIGEGDEEEE
jgi:transcription initiation factor TFIID subunit 7